jgi:hypothetical protein
VNPRIEQLRQAIEKACQCKARHSGSTAVIEGFEGQAVWDGVVEAFDLQGHPEAKRCYPFRFVENGGTTIKTVLGIPPVDSLESAVKVKIASKAKFQ